MPRLSLVRVALLTVALTAGLTASGPALAQVSAVRQATLTEGAPVPPTGAAIADDVMSPGINPAGLGSVKGLSLGYLHERDVPLDRIADALFLAAGVGPVTLGFSTHWMRYGDILPNHRKTAWTLALGNELISFGTSLNLFSSHESRVLDRMITWDVGLTVRPWRYFAFGAAAFDLNAPEFGGRRIARRFDLGVGFRPFTDRVEIAVDWRFDDLTPFERSNIDIAVRGEVIEGLLLLAGFSTNFQGEELAGQIGLELRVPHVAGGYALGAQFDETKVASHQAWLRLTSERQRGLDIAPTSYVLIDLERVLGGQTGIASLFQRGDPWLDLMAMLRRVGDDEDIPGVVIKLEGSGALGLARAEALHEALIDLKKRGKKVVSLLIGADDPDYLVALASDRIYAVPAANLLVNGFSVSSTFMGRLLHRLGIDIDVVRVGQYKTAPDEFSSGEMSEADRVQLMAWLNEIYPRYASTLAKARKLEEERAYELLNQGILGANAAQKAGLVDEVIFSDQLVAKLGELEGRSVGLIDGLPDAPAVPRLWGTRPKIALVRIDGLITAGASVGGLLSGKQTGAATVLQALQMALADDSYEALVLAIDSGGGSSLASDLIWRAVRLVAQKKPVIVSLGNVAASGGYYIASAGNEIFASPSTLTGSIGVFMIKPSFGKLLHTLGVNEVILKRGESADLTSLVRTWTDEEKSELTRAIDETYNLFIDRVAEGRGMERGQIEAVAQGRVWGGSAAREKGLVDKFGGLEQAIARAQELARLTDEEVDVEVLGGPGFGERVRALWPERSENALFDKLLGELDAQLILFMLEEEGRAMVLSPWIGPAR